MRILQVSSARNRGGGETHVLELAAALRQRGHDVVVAGRKDGPLHPDIELPLLNSADFISAVRLRTILKKRAFDIVHAHVARDYSVVAAAALGVPRVKLVFTRHLLYPVRPHWLYGRVDGWTAPTRQILETLQPLAPKACTVIPNWVDVEKFEYRLKRLHDPVTIALIGQIVPHKGHDDAIEAMRRLGTKYRLIVAGTGGPAYVDGLKSRASGLPVEFPGFVSVPGFFEEVDILIVPSWEEPFGIVLLEAMASGVPVIATDRGGPAGILAAPERGTLIPPRDSGALAEAILELAADDERRRNIAAKARAHVEKHFDVRTVVPRVEEFYHLLSRATVTAR